MHSSIEPRFAALGEGEVEEKSPGESVTVADREAEALLTAALEAILRAWSWSARRPHRQILLTGLVQSLGTPWGLFRHYWVLVKFLITVVAAVVLVTKLEIIGSLAAVAAEADLSSGDLREDRISFVAHGGGGLLLLLVPMVLSVFKPRGLTGYGRRRRSLSFAA